MGVATQPGWFPDPAGGPDLRWWDGYRWTDQTQPVAVSAAAVKDKRVWLRVLIVLGVVFALGIGGCAALVAASGKALNDTADKLRADQKLLDVEIAREVTLESCGEDSLGFAKASGSLVNGSS